MGKIDDLFTSKGKLLIVDLVQSILRQPHLQNKELGTSLHKILKLIQKRSDTHHRCNLRPLLILLREDRFTITVLHLLNCQEICTCLKGPLRSVRTADFGARMDNQSSQNFRIFDE